MKATGIIRRIDDLGRVVIPQEIRRTLGIQKNDPLEFFVEDGSKLVLQKYDQFAPTKEAFRRLRVQIKDLDISDLDEVISKLYEAEDLMVAGGCGAEGEEA